LSNGDQPHKPFKAVLKVEKNRDGKTEKTDESLKDFEKWGIFPSDIRRVGISEPVQK
jgi:hypothetical protein